MPVGESTKISNTNKNTAQKVVIPKGTINPQETTVIEIPAYLSRQKVVVAKRKSSGCNVKETQYFSNLDDTVDENVDVSLYTNATFPNEAIQNKTNTVPVSSFLQSPVSSFTRASPPAIPNTPKGGYGKVTQTTYIDMRHPNSMCPSQFHMITSPPSTSSNITQCPFGLPNCLPSLPPLVISHTELSERLSLQKDLENFQKARRQLLTNASGLTAKPPISVPASEKERPCRLFCTPMAHSSMVQTSRQSLCPYFQSAATDYSKPTYKSPSSSCRGLSKNYHSSCSPACPIIQRDAEYEPCPSHQTRYGSKWEPQKKRSDYIIPQTDDADNLDQQPSCLCASTSFSAKNYRSSRRYP